MAGTYNSGIGITWGQAWTLLHTAESDAERNTWEEVFFDGRNTAGTVYLSDERIFTAQGVLTPVVVEHPNSFVDDPFTDTNGTSITSHTASTTWATVMTGGTAPTVQSNRLRAAGSSNGKNFYYSNATPPSADYFVEATIYFNADNGQNFDEHDVAVAVRCATTGGGQGYVFGWNYFYSRWELGKWSGGSYTYLWDDSSTDTTRTVGESKTIKLAVSGSSTTNLKCYLDGSLLFERNDSTSPITATGYVGLYFSNDLNNFDINGVFGEALSSGVSQALIGLKATASAIDGRWLTEEFTFVRDTFTDTTGIALTAHTGERGATWTVARNSGSTVWSIQSNEARPSATTGYNYSYASGVPLSPDYVVTANYNYIGNADGYYADTITEGVVARMGTDGLSGYVFGYDFGDSQWQIDKIGTGMLAATSVSPWAGEDVELTLLVTGGATTTLKGFVNGTEVLSVTDSTSPVTAAGKAGLHSYNLTSSKGSFYDFSATQYRAEVSVALGGHRATSAYGTVFGAISMPLTGYAATTAQGSVKVALSVGFITAGPLTPASVRTTQVHLDTFVGRMSSAMLSANGVLYGVAEHYDHESAYYNARRGLLQVDQSAQDTYPWTSYGKAADASSDELDTDCLTYKYEHTTQFPRAGGYSTPTYKYNAAISSTYGFISATPGGDVQTAVVRSLRDEAGAFVVQYLAWQQGTFDEIANSYAGPEFIVGTYRYTGLDDNYYRRAPLGIYAVSSNEALAFYPRLVSSAVSGTYIELVGHCAETAYGTLAPSVASTGLELVGLRAIAAPGLPYPAFDPNKTTELSGHRLSTYSGLVYPVNAQVNAPPAYRRMRNGAWGPEVILTGATGATQNYAIGESLTVTHSGYGDIIFATYFSAQHAFTSTPSHIGLVVMDARSGVVHSHTLTALADTPGTWWAPDAALDGSYRDRTQAEVVTLSSGTSVTQYVQRRHILHLSWTYATRAAPTLTIKDGPAGSLVPGWESLEIRGDEVYHVLYADASGTYDPQSLRVNDATGTGSTWTTVSGALSGPAWSDGGYTIGEHGLLSGSAKGKRTWLYDYRSRYSAGYTYDAATYWVDFWSGQAPLLSVEAKGQVGHVRVTIRENPTLEGLRATTSAGTIEGVPYLVPLEGLRATVTGGYFSFVNLTGRSATATAGTLYGSMWIDPAGQAATATAGELYPVISSSGARLTGLRATAVGGYPRFSGALLEGRAAILQWGTLAVSSSEDETLTGFGLVSASGTLTPNVSTSTLGRSATLTAGVLTLVVAVPYWKLLSQATASAGVLTPSTVTTIQLTGYAAAAAGGTLTPLSEKSDAATGYVATAVSGALSVTVVVPLVGQRAVGTAGAVVPLVAVTPEGRSAVCAQGVHQLLTNIFLTGQGGTCAIGSLSCTYGSTAIVSGVYSKGEVGDATQGMWKPHGEHLLWVFTEPEEPEVAADDEREYVLVAPHD